MTNPSNLSNPFLDPAPEEIHLSEAPLVRVLAQIQFPPIASVEKPAFVGSFQELVRKEYPIMRRERARTVVFRDAVDPEFADETVWRFSTTDGNWQLSLAPNFIALDTTAYQSRADFISRLKAAMTVLNLSEIEPAHVDRIGLRYINRLTGSALDQITKLIRPEVLGVLSSSLASYSRLAVNETHFAPAPEKPDTLVAKWAMLPANQTFDPAVLVAIDHRSWVLDLDMFGAYSQPFDPEKLADQLDQYASCSYSVFRWAVTDQFLRHFGGAV